MMKYIVYESKTTGQKFPIIFPADIEHASVHQGLSNNSRFEAMNPVSAGFLSMSPIDGELRTGGDSISMNLKPTSSDSILIYNWFTKTR